MEKKNPYKFTIGLKENLPKHRRAAEILNQTKDKASLIAEAILYYLGESEACATDGTGMETLIKKMI